MGAKLGAKGAKKKPKPPKDATVGAGLRKQRKRSAEGKQHRLGFDLIVEEDLYHTVTTMTQVGTGLSAVPIEKQRKIMEPRLLRCWRQQAEAAAEQPVLSAESQPPRFEERAEELRTADKAAGRGKAQKSQREVYAGEWLHFENFILKTRNEDHPDYQLVDGWRNGNSTFDRPISVVTIEIYFRHLSMPKTEQIVPGVFGRALGYESVAQAKKAIVHFHAQGCRVNGYAPNKQTYVEHPDVMIIVNSMIEEHVAEGAPEFEFVSGVRAMRIAIFNNPTTTPLEKAYQWAIILMALNHMLRKSDMCGEYCPDAVTIETPNDLDEWDIESGVCELPNSFSWICHKWKATHSAHCKAHRLRTVRNMISPLYCPMLAYMDFAASCSLTFAIAIEQKKPLGQRYFVAMFPMLSGKGVDPYTPATVTMMDSLIGPVLRDAFPQLAPNIPTPHSLRVVGLIWYLRCQIPEERSKKAGRWMGLNLKSWSKYTRGGSEEAAKWRAKQQLDPVFYFWCAQDSFVGFVRN